MVSRLCFNLAIGLLLFPSQVCGDHVWNRTVGGPGNCTVEAIALEASGNIVVTGEFLGATDFGGGALPYAGNYDVYVAKYDPTGNYIWSRAFGSLGSDRGYGVAVDNLGNVFVTGSFEGAMNLWGDTLTCAGQVDIFLAKFDAEGNHLWSAAYGAENIDIGHSLAVDGQGNVITTGLYSGTVDFGGGPLVGSGTAGDIFIAKYDAIGEHMWSKRFGWGSTDWGRVLVVDDADNIIVSGFFHASIDFGGGMRSSVGGADVFLVKYAPNGAHMWSRTLGGPFNDYVEDVCLGPSHGIVMTGHFSASINLGGATLTSTGERDVFLGVYDSEGNHRWSKRFGGTDTDVGYAVGVDAQGNHAVTGRFYGGTIDFGGDLLTSSGSDDGFAATFDAFGSHVWSFAFGAASNDWGDAIRFTSLGNVLLGGSVLGTVDIGGETPLTTGAFLAEFTGAPQSSDIHDAGARLVTRLSNYPNPFNPRTSISITTRETLMIHVTLYDLHGHLVRNLHRGTVPPGMTEFIWDGRGDDGAEVGSGVYFCRISGGGQIVTTKLTLIK